MAILCAIQFTLNFIDIYPRMAGGAVIRPPLRFFADSDKTAARSAAKFPKKTMTR